MKPYHYKETRTVIELDKEGQIKVKIPWGYGFAKKINQLQEYLKQCSVER